MTNTPFTESVVEEAALAWLAELDWTITPGPAIALGKPTAGGVSCTCTLGSDLVQ